MAFAGFSLSFLAFFFSFSFFFFSGLAASPAVTLVQSGMVLLIFTSGVSPTRLGAISGADFFGRPGERFGVADVAAFAVPVLGFVVLAGVADFTVFISVFTEGLAAGLALAVADGFLADATLLGLAAADLVAVVLAEAVLVCAVLAGVDLAEFPVDAFFADAVLRVGVFVVFASTDFAAFAATGFADVVFSVAFAVADADLAGVDFFAAGFEAAGFATGFTEGVVSAFLAVADLDAVFLALADFAAVAFGAADASVVFAGLGVDAFAFGRPDAFEVEVFVPAGLGFGAVVKGFLAATDFSAVTVGVFVLGAFVVLVLAVATGFSTGWVVLGVLAITLILADHLRNVKNPNQKY